MARKAVNDIDGGKLYQLKNWLLHKTTSDDGSPVDGQHQFRTDLGRFRVWSQTLAAWVNLATDSDKLQGNDSAFHRARANHTGSQLANTISDLATVVKAYRLDEFAVPTANLNINSQRLTSVADPVSAQDVATMAYVLALVNGQDWKNSVRAATTAALPANTRSGNVLTASANGTLPAIDGVTLSVNDPVLVKNEATGANNGVYIVTSVGSGATPWVLTRRSDADSSAEVTAGFSVDVTEGTLYQDKGFTLTTDDPITLNTTALTFSQGPSSTVYLAGAGMLLSGNTFAVNPGNGIIADGTSTRVDPSVVARKYTTLIGDGVATSFVLPHSLNNQYPLVQLYDMATGDLFSDTFDYDATSTTTGTIVVGSALATNGARAVLIG